MYSVLRLASAEQHGPQREDDGIGHENDGLPGLTLRLYRDPLLSTIPPKVRHDCRRQRDDLLLHHSLTLLEVRQDCHSDNVLLDNVLFLRCVERRTVGVGGISILQLRQTISSRLV